MKDYLVYGTRYSGMSRVLEWITDHQEAGYISTNYKLHKDGTYNRKPLLDHRYFIFTETSLVYNEELMLCRNTTNYTKSIIVFRDIYDVIAEILKKTRKSVEKAIAKQVNLFEEYSDELLNETHKIPQGYELFVNYDRWLLNVDYRNKIGLRLGFENTDLNDYDLNIDMKIRKTLRYKRYKTRKLTELNDKTLYSDNCLYV